MNLLVVTDRFPHKYDHASAAFVKELVNAEAKYFEKIYVLSLNPWLPKYLARKMSNPRWLRDSMAENYTYNNMDVRFLKYPSFPLKSTIAYRDGIVWHLYGKKIKKIIEKKNISIIHAHFIHPAASLAVRIKRTSGIKLITTGHGHDVRVYPFLNESLRKKTLNTLNDSDAVITVSKDNEKKLREIGYKNEIHIIPNGYAPEIFKPIDKETAKEKVNLPKDKRIIISVGRIDYLKGFWQLIEVVKKMKKQDKQTLKEILFVIVGDGPDRAQLIRKIHNLGFDEHFLFVGEQQHENISYYINSSEFFVLPSLDEGNPTVMFESLGCGVPFVGTRVGGVPEIITSEEYGLLCDPKDVNCLAEKINIALNKKWNKEIILKYAERFTWSYIAEKTIGIYKRTLNQGT